MTEAGVSLRRAVRQERQAVTLLCLFLACEVPCATVWPVSAQRTSVENVWVGSTARDGGRSVVFTAPIDSVQQEIEGQESSPEMAAVEVRRPADSELGFSCCQASRVTC